MIEIRNSKTREVLWKGRLDHLPRVGDDVILKDRLYKVDTVVTVLGFTDPYWVVGVR